MTPSTRPRAEGVAALVSGLLFGLGLAIAGMTRPDKIIGFLSFFQRWDPTMAFVMAGAVAVHAAAFRVITRRSSPLLAARFFVPARRDLDARLLAGAALFGVGWALSGFCPGPGIAAIVVGSKSALVFVAAMIGGNLLAARAEPAIARALERKRPSEPA